MIAIAQSFITVSSLSWAVVIKVWTIATKHKVTISIEKQTAIILEPSLTDYSKK